MGGFLANAAQSIPIIGNIVSSAINASQSRKNVKDQIKANRELAEYGWNKNLEMWNLQNEYNTPTMQMQRFKEAGLNPHLIYGQGTPGNAQTMPKYQAIRQDYSGRKSVVGQAAQGAVSALAGYQDFAMKNAQIDNARAIADTNRTEAMYRESKLFNEILYRGALADQQRMNKEWMYSSDESGKQKGMKLLDY